VESSDRRFNVFKTRNVDLKVAVKEEFGEKMKDYLDKLDKEVDEFLGVLKATKFDEEAVDSLMKNDFRLKLKFETNNKIKLLKDLVLKKEYEELDKFLEHLKNENDVEDIVELKFKDDEVIKIDTSSKNIEAIKEQLKNGGFVTAEQVKVLVTLMYFKDVQEKENNLKDKINKFNKMFSLVSAIKVNNKVKKIRSCEDLDFFEKEREVIVNKTLYIVKADVKKGKLRFKRVKELMEEVKVEEI